MKSKYDMHIATEAGDSATLKADLNALGFQDDNLAFQGLIFDPETAQHYKSCPLIDVHASKKVATRDELLTLEGKVHELMLTHGVTGYWHSESIKADEHIESTNPFIIKPLPFRRLQSRPRNTKKVWDIHLSMRDDILPEALRKILIEHGLYYLARLKTLPDVGEKRFAVFTVQGIN